MASYNSSIDNHKIRKVKYCRLSNESGNSNLSDNEEDRILRSEHIEMQKRHSKVNAGTSTTGSSGTPVKFITDYDNFVERPIQKGETLASVSLKYRIPVSEIKRVNKLFQDNEFFALSHLKIPVKANSCLSEILDREQQEIDEKNIEVIDATNISRNQSLHLGMPSLSSCSEYESESEMHVGYISIDRILRDTRNKKEAQRFLKNMQKDLAKIREKTNSYKDSLEEVTATLTNVRFHPLMEPDRGCSGADWGIKWWKVLLAGLTLVIVVPLVYIFLLLPPDHITTVKNSIIQTNTPSEQ